MRNSCVFCGKKSIERCVICEAECCQDCIPKRVIHKYKGLCPECRGAVSHAIAGLKNKTIMSKEREN